MPPHVEAIMNHDESKHPRKGDGKFATKSKDDPGQMDLDAEDERPTGITYTDADSTNQFPFKPATMAKLRFRDQAKESSYTDLSTLAPIDGEMYNLRIVSFERGKWTIQVWSTTQVSDITVSDKRVTEMELPSRKAAKATASFMAGMTNEELRARHDRGGWVSSRFDMRQRLSDAEDAASWLCQGWLKPQAEQA